MLLKDVIKNVEISKIIGDSNIEINNIQTISNNVTKGSLFICISGNNVDSHDLVKKVVDFGAVAVITEREIDCSITQIVVKDTRRILPLISNNFYDNPTKKLKIVGVTGTNGKTSITYIIKNIFDSAKIKCGVIGTLGVVYDDKFISSDLTTPDPLELFKYFDLMAKNDVKIVVMEVSAHAIYYKKIYGIEFDVGVFTNCTQDHLDFFENMENYSKVKYSFFKDYNFRYIISNSDDKLGRKIIGDFTNTISYGIDNPADIFAIDIVENEFKNTFVLNLFDKIYQVKSNMLGKFNIYNIMASCMVCAIFGVDLDLIVKSIEEFCGVNGRLEKIYSKDFQIYIDYAHTPDGLKNSILTLKNSTDGKLITIFGCGGNRDKGKREIMGKISGELSDFTVITTDNPRFEEPYSIIEQVERGIIPLTRNYVCIENRVKAIEYAINLAKKGDTILIAGKGAENYQEILGIKYPFSDKDCVDSIIKGTLS